MSESHEESALSFEDPEDEGTSRVYTEKVNVTAFDKFRLAKLILIFSAILYVLAAVAYILIPEKTKEVWEHAKVVLNSIVTLVIGFYFGRKER